MNPVLATPPGPVPSVGSEVKEEEQRGGAMEPLSEQEHGVMRKAIRQQEVRVGKALHGGWIMQSLCC